MLMEYVVMDTLLSLSTLDATMHTMSDIVIKECLF